MQSQEFLIYCADQPTSRSELHAHQEIQLTISLGAATCRVTMEEPGGGLATREASGTSVSLFPSHRRHALQWLENGPIVMIYLSPEFLQRVAEAGQFQSIELQSRVLVRDLLLEQLAAMMFEEIRSGNDRLLFYESVLNVVVVRLLRSQAAETPVHQRPGSALGRARLRRILEFIDAHLEKDLALQDLAQIAGLSRTHFATLFRNAVGLPPHQYVTRARLHAAARRLRDTDEDLAQVAQRYGFSSQSHFTRLFSREWGMTPARFRRERHNEELNLKITAFDELSGSGAAE